MKRLLCPTILFLAAACLPAWTFMIDTRALMTPGTDELPVRKALVSLENGLMDTLFEEGHIFFNRSELAEEGVELDDGQKFLPLHLARRAGADWLLKVEIGTGSRISYEFFRVAPARQQGTGRLDDGTVPREPGQTEEEWFFRVGTRLYGEILPLME